MAYPMCWMTLDRDLNAALNLEQYYHCRVYLHPNYVVAGSLSETLSASGEVGRPYGFRRTSTKQEIRHNHDQRVIDVYDCQELYKSFRTGTTAVRISSYS
ncbi:MAG: hypothetical protein ACFFCW_42305 [Candidatus Hodarchaeota archaeon]